VQKKAKKKKKKNVFWFKKIPGGTGLSFTWQRYIEKEEEDASGWSQSEGVLNLPMRFHL